MDARLGIARFGLQVGFASPGVLGIGPKTMYSNDPRMFLECETLSPRIS